ncbi:EPIDERMAL PATTERNING FACTOR-like protein 3 [Ziziphus jujuba]|uniref:Epidermal patterning factor-like protein n=2 Tax=Ziziphus jujuba TaxID=326968 RepID=A0ABM4AE47_ZIZJJ|nr:EPIDERMAL PATTERNING FACTOR-like protein 3 [Ziziphus jujuba]KAH7519227.1 hypothetical protein FEM48_Zijuj08G0013300 [Ziziphus jujuba var. spinosa]
MKRRMCYILMALLAGWVSVISRPFPSDIVAHRQDQISHPPQAAFDSTQGLESKEIAYGKEEEYRRQSRLGSKPPNCENKCQGCVPCFPVQIPTTTDHIGVQNSNYEPEGWKCKCGSSFFNP